MAISFSLTNDAGGKFTINSSTGAVATAAGNIPSGTYNITVRATDANGWVKDTVFPITVTVSGSAGTPTILGTWGTPGTTGAVAGNDFSVSNGGAHASCKVGAGHTSGKYTAEFEIILKGNVGVTKPQIGFGIADAGASVNGYLGASAKSAMYWLETDGIFSTGITDGGTAPNAGTSGVGDKFQVHLDIDNGKAWISKNGVLLGTGSPNPATGAAPYLTFTPGGSTWFIGVTTMAFGGDTKIRLATSLSTPAPSGYTAQLAA